MALGALALAAGVFWFVSCFYLTAGLLDLIAFAAPAAVLGLAIAWASRAMSPERFTWHTGLVGAMAGVAFLTPFLGAVVVLVGAWGLEPFLGLFVAGAWLALAGGLALSAAMLVARRRGRRDA